MNGMTDQFEHIKPFSIKGKTIWVAGHRGMVGSALIRRLVGEDCTVLNVGRADLDLMRSDDVLQWLKINRPHAVFVAAAHVGGILANSTYPADFLYKNMMIAANVVHAAHVAGVEKLLYLGSSCIYPRLAAQPIAEDSLMTGPLEPTNEWYAVAKIAGIKLCQAYRRQHGCDFISAMPTNLYGPADNYDLATGHVAAALIRKAHEAKMRGDPQLVLWGTGTPLREFLHVDDCADALVFLMKNYSSAAHINVGSGSELSIAELAHRIAKVVGFDGRITLDSSKPDGTPRKLMDSGRLNALGWRPRIGLDEGLRNAYDSFLAQEPHV